MTQTVQYIAVRGLEFHCINYVVQIEAYGDLFGLKYDLNHGLSHNLEVDPFSNVVAVGAEREQQVLCPSLRSGHKTRCSRSAPTAMPH